MPSNKGKPQQAKKVIVHSFFADGLRKEGEARRILKAIQKNVVAYEEAAKNKDMELASRISELLAWNFKHNQELVEAAAEQSVDIKGFVDKMRKKDDEELWEPSWRENLPLKKRNWV